MKNYYITSDYKKVFFEDALSIDLSSMNIIEVFLKENSICEHLNLSNNEISNIITATPIDNNGFSYVLNFYNGGTVFNECLTEALNNLR